LYCNEKIGNCFSPIALTESLVFKDFYENNIKIVFNKKETPERTPLVGAYVKVPIPGKYQFICCNDFASLYPSTIITCNLSFENYVGAFYDEKALKYYKEQSGKFIIIGGQVYVNDGKPNKPKLGDFVGNFIDEDALAKYRTNKNYFVSVNGHVYRNDKEYTFKRIQRKLKAERNIDKYLGKKIEAEVVTDIRHLLKGAHEEELHVYDQDIIEALELLNYTGYKCGEDFKRLSHEELEDAERIIYAECKFKESHQMAMKLLGNSMYGGCSHVAFYFYNMNLANDITGEARNVIHLMEHHIPQYFEDHWFDMKAEHKRWGIEVNQLLRGKVRDLCIPIYGDTDSIYSSYQNLLRTIKGIDKMTDKQKLDIILKLNTDFLDKHNFDYMKEYYAKRFADSVQNFELETIASSGVWLTSKKKYAQILLWKDGTFYDDDDLPMKIRGLEVVKSSTSKMARAQLKAIIRKLLEINDTPENETSLLNIEVQEQKAKFMKSDVEDVSGSCNVNTYRDYVVTDDGDAPVFKPKVPYNVRALAKYNNIIKKNHFKEEPVYTGKLKWYIVKSKMRTKDTEYFAFQSKNLPDWSQKFAPIDKKQMFQKQVLDPFNRILESIGYKTLEIDGNLQIDLFSMF
jgi:DNA polymerase elongation subunit (family B)